MREEKRRNQILILLVVILVIAFVSAFALMENSSGTGNTAAPNTTPSQGNTTNKTPGSNTSAPAVPLERMGIIDMVKDITVPPYLEVDKLYQPFPVVVSAYQALDTSLVWFYYTDSNGDTYPAKMVSLEQQGTRDSLEYYVFDVKLGAGFFQPGGTWFIMVYNGTGQRVNLTILAPTSPSGLEYSVTRDDNSIRVSISNNNLETAAIQELYIANCGPSTGVSMFTVDPYSTIQVSLPANDCPHGVLTGYALVQMGDKVYVDIFEIPAS